MPRTEDDEKLIEIFDVVIRTPNRLIVRDENGRDIHTTSAYLDMVEEALNPANLRHREAKVIDQEANDQDDRVYEDEDDTPVYDISSVQKRLYDVTDD